EDDRRLVAEYEMLPRRRSRVERDRPGGRIDPAVVRCGDLRVELVQLVVVVVPACRRGREAIRVRRRDVHVMVAEELVVTILLEASGPKVQGLTLAHVEIP